MRTVGVDVSRDPATTAVCTIRWESGAAVVETVRLRADDADVKGAAMAPDVAVMALDAPFGWPTAMVSAVSAWRPGGRWNAPKEPAPFRLRRTDEFTSAALKRVSNAKELRPPVPLSVSADKLAMAAWRCCRLLSDLSETGVEVITDGLGTPYTTEARPRLVEAYPAAALSMWGIARDGYKRSDDAAQRKRLEMIDAIERTRASEWLRWEGDARARCAATDHALDALVCALVARAAMLGRVERVPSELRDAARAEGWIALPQAGSLPTLSAST